MIAKVSVFIATSLDGFIARRDGSLDWLGAPVTEDQEDYGYREFIDSVDALIMGRNTFEKALSFGAWPYSGKRVVVLTRGAVKIPAELANTVSAAAAAPRELVKRLSAEGASHLYVDGGITAQRFLSAGLIDELTITRIPLLLGEGIPLFGPTGGDILLRHLATRSYDNGYVQSKYRVVGD